MKPYILLLLFITIFSSCQPENSKQENTERVVNTVKTEPQSKDSLWVFVLAGQSNMSGRGALEAVDTLTDQRILMLDSQMHWVSAREPLHGFYEPGRAGTGSGFAFAKALLPQLPKGVKIGLVPTAIGGSSINRWLGDSLFRQQYLATNFKKRTKEAMKVGTIKAILWHQGESNSSKKGIINYDKHLEVLFGRFRKVAQNDSLPILTGQLGAFFVQKSDEPYPAQVNRIIKNHSVQDPNVHLIQTDDLTHKGDSVHFDAASQRTMGQRYANLFLSL